MTNLLTTLIPLKARSEASRRVYRIKSFDAFHETQRVEPVGFPTGSLPPTSKKNRFIFRF